MSSTNRYEKAQKWLTEPEKHLHSLIQDEDTVSAVVIGETGEYLVAIGPEGRICGCMANRVGSTCSHLLFFLGYLSSRGITYRGRNLHIPNPTEEEYE